MPQASQSQGQEIQNVSSSYNSLYDSIAYGIVKTTLLKLGENQRSNKWHGLELSIAIASDNLVFTRL